MAEMYRNYYDDLKILTQVFSLVTYKYNFNVLLSVFYYSAYLNLFKSVV